MRVYCASDYYHASRAAANIISAQVIMKPDCVLGLATGSTPIGAYEQLIRWYEKDDSRYAPPASSSPSPCCGKEAHPDNK